MNTRAQRDFESRSADQVSSQRPSLATCSENTLGKLEDFVQREPRAAMLASLGAGLGIGLLIGAALARADQSPRGFHVDRRSAEQLGQRLMDAISSAVPASISNYFGN